MSTILMTMSAVARAGTVRRSRAAVARGAVAALVAVASLASASPVRADERVECAHAYEQSQRFQQKDESYRALEMARRCARPSCPAILADECKQWEGQLREQVSRLEVTARSADACGPADFTVQIDRVPRTPPAEIWLDPGIHEVRVIDGATGAVKDETIDISKGERRTLAFDFAPAGAVCKTGPTLGAKPPVPRSALVFGIAGGALVLTGLTFGLVGAVKQGDLDECKPNCSSERIEAVRSFFVAGDIVGGVGVVSVVVGAVIYMIARSDVQRRTSASALAPPATTSTSPTLLLGPRGVGLSF